MDSRQLKYFISVAEERSISKAAKCLHISQPPLTRHIQALEKELNVLLFSRTPWGVELTDAGEELLIHARNINDHFELAAEIIRHQARWGQGKLDIGVFGSALLTDLPPILNIFTDIHPEVKVVIHNISKEQQIEALRQGHIQISFDRYLPDLPDLQVELVTREKFLVALPRRNPLANQETVHINELKNKPMISGRIRNGVNVNSPLTKLWHHYGFEPNVVQRASNLISAIAMVAGGFGCAIVPESLQIMQLPDVVFRPLIADIAIEAELFCIYRQGKLPPLLAEFLKIVRAYSSNH